MERLNKPIIKILIVCSISLIWAVSFGLNYGISNQNTYLLHGLHIANPELLADDWLTTQCTDYHPYFTYIACLLYTVSSSGWIFALANVLANMLGGILVYLILTRIVNDKYAVLTYVFLIGVVSFTSTFSVAGSYIFSWTFQPSTLGSLGFLAGVLFFFKGRYLLSGFLYALGGIFHANFIVLAFPLFGLAHLLLGRQQIGRRLFTQLAWPGVALLVLLPLLLKASSSPVAEAGRYLFMEMHAPQHYVPMLFIKEFICFAGWHVLAFAWGWNFFTSPETKSRFRALIFSHLGLIAIATLLTTVVYIPVVAQLYVWRLAPFSVLLAQIMFSIWVVKYLVELPAPTVWFTRSILVMFVGVVLTSGHYVRWEKYNLPGLLLLILILVAAGGKSTGLRKLLSDRKHLLCTCVVLLTWMFGATCSVWHLDRKSSLLTGFPASEEQLHTWASSTPVETCFLIPPNLERFRLNARRAVVADWKSTPVYPEELLEWYDRVQVISGVPGVTSVRTAEEGYAGLDSNRLSDIQKRYEFDYAVFRKESVSETVTGIPRVYENDDFVVVHLNPEEDQPESQ